MRACLCVCVSVCVCVSSLGPVKNGEKSAICLKEIWGLMKKFPNWIVVMAHKFKS